MVRWVCNATLSAKQVRKQTKECEHQSCNQDRSHFYWPCGEKGCELLVKKSAKHFEVKSRILMDYFLSNDLESIGTDRQVTYNYVTQRTAIKRQPHLCYHEICFQNEDDDQQ